MWTVWKITEIILDQSIKNIFPNQLNTSTFYRIKKKEKIMIKPIKMTPPRKRERKNFKTIYIYRFRIILRGNQDIIPLKIIKKNNVSFYY